MGSFGSEAMLGGRYLPTPEQIQEVESAQRDILGPTVTIGLGEARTRFANLLAEADTESIREWVREYRLIGMGALYGPKVVEIEGIDEPLDDPEPPQEDPA